MTSKSVERVARLVPDGDLEAPTVQALRNDLDVLLNDPEVETIVIDLQYVRFLDSSGLGALIDARRNAGATGTSLLLSNPGSQVRRLMTVTQTYEAFSWE